MRVLMKPRHIKANFVCSIVFLFLAMVVWNLVGAEKVIGLTAA